jgi:hypothetical protein
MNDLIDYLKSDCRSWEIEPLTQDDINTLVSMLSQRFPNINEDEIFSIVKDWFH